MLIDQSPEARGFSISENKWIYGRVLDYNTSNSIIVSGIDSHDLAKLEMHIVDVDSLGYNLRVTDTNMRTVFTGDILTVTEPDREERNEKGDLVHCQIVIQPGDPVISNFEVIAMKNDYHGFYQHIGTTSMFCPINQYTVERNCFYDIEKVKFAYLSNSYAITKRGFSWDKDYARLKEIYNIQNETELVHTFGMRITGNVYEKRIINTRTVKNATSIVRSVLQKYVGQPFGNEEFEKMQIDIQRSLGLEDTD